MATMKIKKGDMVRVISGSERDNEGKVIAVDREKHRVYVEGGHMVKKHMKPSMANQTGGIVEQEGPIDISNVMLLVDGETTRVGFKMEGDKKVRYAKKTGKVID
ncbi:MAG: 50S ribosomal protein L24 [Lachnospiraceae bacterium]|nr:50S ribosomal protein L24 [Lachnospiraceae bacterium]